AGGGGDIVAAPQQQADPLQSEPAGRAATRTTAPCPPTRASAASPACAARRSRCWRACPPTTTPASSRAAASSPPSRSSTPSPALSAWTTPAAPTCTIWSPRRAPRPRARAAVQRVCPGLYQLLDSLDTQPALILGRRTDVLAANRLARALFTDFESMPPRERNYARWMLLSEQARALFLDWERQARNAVESLRFDAGRTPDDPETHKL